MDTKRIVITGGPGSGKTALINFLENEGHHVMHEISREVIQQAQKEGIEQLFLEDSMLFSQKLMDGRLKQFKAGDLCEVPILFYDRGMPDVTAYLDYVNEMYPLEFEQNCRSHRYDYVFVLPPWKEIYKQDNERYESYEEAEKIFQFLKSGYENYGYLIHEVPMGAVKNRVQHILETIKKLY